MIFRFNQKQATHAISVTQGGSGSLSRLSGFQVVTEKLLMELNQHALKMLSTEKNKSWTIQHVSRSILSFEQWPQQRKNTNKSLLSHLFWRDATAGLAEPDPWPCYLTRKAAWIASWAWKTEGWRFTAPAYIHFQHASEPWSTPHHSRARSPPGRQRSGGPGARSRWKNTRDEPSVDWLCFPMQQ